LIYPRKLENTTEPYTSASYLDTSLKLDADCKPTTQLHDILNDFNFFIKFPYLCSNILLSPAHGVDVYQLIRYTKACFAYDQFLVETGDWPTNWFTGISIISIFCHHFKNVVVVITI
jgi:hypothetical protein